MPLAGLLRLRRKTSTRDHLTGLSYRNNSRFGGVIRPNPSQNFLWAVGSVLLAHFGCLVLDCVNRFLYELFPLWMKLTQCGKLKLVFWKRRVLRSRIKLCVLWSWMKLWILWSWIKLTILWGWMRWVSCEAGYRWVSCEAGRSCESCEAGLSWVSCEAGLSWRSCEAGLSCVSCEAGWATVPRAGGCSWKLTVLLTS